VNESTAASEDTTTESTTTSSTSQGDSTDTNSSTTSDSTPGFGLLATVLSLLVVASLARRRVHQ
jgi:PGF-CTERM protein